MYSYYIIIENNSKETALLFTILMPIFSVIGSYLYLIYSNKCGRKSIYLVGLILLILDLLIMSISAWTNFVWIQKYFILINRLIINGTLSPVYP